MDKNDLAASGDGPTKFDKLIMWVFLAAVVIGLGFGAWALLVHA